jgi:two-component sensor histidine kinase
MASALSGRIANLACTHDLIAEEQWRGAHFRELVSRQVEYFVDREARRVDLSGPDFLMEPSAAQHVGMALHELCVNAVQHGALSQPAGKVFFRWKWEGQMSGKPWLHVSWGETNGPPAKMPERKGFGFLVLERLAPEGLGGSATLVFRADGAAWLCEVPGAKVLA